MKTSLLQRIEGFYEQTNTEKQATLGELLQTINLAPKEFIESFHSEKFDYLNNLPIIYEALSNDLNNWADFFLAELKRLIATAKAGDSPKRVLTHLDELSFIDAEIFKHRDAFVAILSAELDNPHRTFRYYAISLLPDFIRQDDTSATNKLRGRLQDPDWRIRYWAFKALQDLDKLSSTDRLSVPDMLRSKLVNTINFQ
ncbi:HEAT repeat domain-containing protein [Hymenobacter glacialis]|nr:HEAT repeat domain-containing protein [Hymenobacter glacialis]